MLEKRIITSPELFGRPHEIFILMRMKNAASGLPATTNAGTTSEYETEATRFGAMLPLWHETHLLLKKGCMSCT